MTRGPYHWVRHPVYDSAALLVLASALIAANWFVLLTGALVFVLLAVRTGTEERNLETRFGQSYRAYRDATGRSCPDSRGASRTPRPSPDTCRRPRRAERLARRPSAYSSVFQCTASKSIVSARPCVMCFTICAA